jgi:hypothetical protein
MEWNTYVRTLQNMYKKQVWMQAREVWLILGDNLGSCLSHANYYIVMKTIVVALKDFVNKQPYMVDIYITIGALCHHMIALKNAFQHGRPSSRSARRCLYKETKINCPSAFIEMVLFSIHISFMTTNCVTTKVHEQGF